MNINPFERVETNGKRLKTDLSLIFNRIDENDIVDIYAMRIYNCYLQADLNSRTKLKLREKQTTTNEIIFIFFANTHFKTILANAQMAHLVFVNTQANASKNQKSHFLPTL